MNTRYRQLILAIFGLALAGTASIAQARDRHVDFSIHLPHLSISSGHGYYAPHHGYYRPLVVGHYHGRQLCHLRHDTGHAYGERDHHYYDRHPRRYRDHHDRGHYYGR